MPGSRRPAGLNIIGRQGRKRRMQDKLGVQGTLGRYMRQRLARRRLRQVLLDEAGAQMNIELDKRLRAEALETVDLTCFDDENVPGARLELVTFYGPQLHPTLHARSDCTQQEREWLLAFRMHRLRHSINDEAAIADCFRPGLQRPEVPGHRFRKAAG